MKNLALLIATLWLLYSCEEPASVEPSTYACDLSFADNSAFHTNNDQFQSLIDEMATKTVGIQAAITTGGDSWIGSSGMADIQSNIALENCHQLMIGSISKVFTGVLIMQLQDEGVLSVDDPLRNWLDQSVIGDIDNANEVTLTHLLTHTSGIRDYLSAEQHLNAINTPWFKETQLEKLKYIYGKDAYFEPDDRFGYSNTNYVLLGLVVEKARNMTLWDAVELYITQPLDLLNCEMGTHDNPIPTGTARPYLAVRGGKYQDIMQYAVSDAATGDGGIASNMQDLNVFIESLFAGDLMSQEALTQMISTTSDASDGPSYEQWEGEQYGLGIEIYHTPDGIAYGHTGSTSSYNAFLLHFPDQQVTISMAFNAYDESGKHDKAIEKLIEDFMDLTLN